MKKIIYTIVAIAAICAVSCKKEAYIPGVADREDCINVEFLDDKEQALAGSCELSPEQLTYTIKLSRAVTDGAIEVPLEAVCAKYPGIIKVDNAIFDDGADATEVNVYFSEAVENGVEYICDIQIKGNEFALNYGFAKTIHSFTAIFTTWTDLGSGTFTSNFFGSNSEAHLLKNDDNDKRFRIKNAHPNFPNIDFYLKSELLKDNDGDSFYIIRVPKFTTRVSYGSYGIISYSDYDVYTGASYEKSVYYPDYGQVYIDAVYSISLGNLMNKTDYFIAN